MNDQFLMRGTFGIPYEFLWANPYQPRVELLPCAAGVSRRNFWPPLRAVQLGRFRRSGSGLSMDSFNYSKKGKITMLNPELTREPLDLDEAVVFFGKTAHRFQDAR